MTERLTDLKELYPMTERERSSKSHLRKLSEKYTSNRKSARNDESQEIDEKLEKFFQKREHQMINPPKTYDI